MQPTINAELETRNSKPTPGTCRGCGCSEDWACEGGCAWADAERTFCSRCVMLLVAECCTDDPAGRVIVDVPLILASCGQEDSPENRQLFGLLVGQLVAEGIANAYVEASGLYELQEAGAELIVPEKKLWLPRGAESDEAVPY